MSAKKNYWFFLLLVVSLAGCNLLAERQSPPNVETVPPYWQKQKDMEELQAFHNKEAAKMSAEQDDVHIVRNSEMERLAAVEKELKREQDWQDDYEKTMERREKWFGWMNKESKAEPETRTAAKGNSDKS